MIFLTGALLWSQGSIAHQAEIANRTEKNLELTAHYDGGAQYHLTLQPNERRALCFNDKFYFMIENHYQVDAECPSINGMIFSKNLVGKDGHYEITYSAGRFTIDFKTY